MNVIRLKGRLHVGNRVFYKGDVIDLDRYPDVKQRLDEIAEEKKKKKEEKAAESPSDKMMRSQGYKRK